MTEKLIYGFDKLIFMQSNNFIPFDESDEYINEINRKYAHREVKNAKESERFLNEVCRYCNLYARCIETERYENGHVRRLCLMLSSLLKQVWIDVSERRKKFVFDKLYGKLTPVCYLCKKKGRWYILCKCECGNLTEVRQNNLVSGEVISCGCERGKRSSRTSYNIYEERYPENPGRVKPSEDGYLRRVRMPSPSSLNEYSSPVGKSVWRMVEKFVKPDNTHSSNAPHRTWEKMLCDECGGVIRLDEHLFPVCERCGLVAEYVCYEDDNGDIVFIK